MSENTTQSKTQAESKPIGPFANNIPPGMSDKLLARLSIARDRLVDRNLRNKLISTNLNTSRTKNIRFFNVDSENIFNTLYNNKNDMYFNPINEPSEDNQLLIENSTESVNISANQLQTKLEKESLQKKLKSLYFEAQEYEEEQGVNILFIALGFVKWFEDDTSDVERYAPLVLLPVELVRDGAKDKFRLKPRDEDLFTNISLKLWLKEQNSIELPDIPEEDSWLLNDYCEQVRLAITQETRWEILPNESVLGFFSFNKFLLWRDLDPENWPEGKGLLEHSIVQRLLMPPKDNNYPDPPIVQSDKLIDDYFTPADLVYVVDADSSQTEAIQTVLSGRDLVIQGPPGTGKSQTITNIIAAAVAKGKKVLFIAEKMAALNVVHERLSKVGLGVICLELHSRKATKRAVLKQIRDSVEFPDQPQVPNNVLNNLIESQDFLNKHAKRVNEPRDPWGFSPFEIMGEIAKFHRLGLNIFNFSIPNSISYTKLKLEVLSNRLVDLGDRLKKSGIPEKHPWCLSEAGALTPMDIERLEKELHALKALNDKFRDLVNELSSNVSLSSEYIESFTLDDFNWLFAVVTSKISTLPDVPLSVLISRKMKANLVDLQAIALKINEFKTYKKITDDQFIANWELFDLTDLRIKLAGSGGSIFSFLNKTYRNSIRSLKGLLRQGLPNGFKNRLALIDQALLVKSLEYDVSNVNAEIKVELGSIWKGGNSDEQVLIELFEWYQIFIDIDEIKENIIVKLIGNQAAWSLISDIANLIRHFSQKLSEICLATKIKFESVQSLSFYELDIKITSWYNNSSRINEWSKIRNDLHELKSEIGEECHAKVFKGEIQADHINPVIRVSILENIWQSIVAVDQSLSDIDAFKLDKELGRFRKSDKERLKIASMEVLEAYSKNCPKGTNGEMLSIRQEIAKKRNNYPVRKLMSKAGRAIHELKPVFLMSPMSIAQFIAPGSMTFDLVLIDEASQVRPEDTLGAIARAKQVVVVGDIKQLPPTNFFNRITEDSDREEFIDDDESYFFNDVESILDLCDSVFQNKVMLRWHYRSQHPGLIAVSNRNFYDNKLLLPPSVLRANYEDGFGVSFVRSPQNGYKRGGPDGGRNILEAELIAKEVISFAKTHPDKSLGVAAFSVAQRDAIRDLIDEYRRKHQEVEYFFSVSKHDSFFVKNLESIQGDERDVIFISVGYGRSEDGRLTQTFGPLAADGGERRLNVLISRAKECCKVFSSITAEDIKVSPGKLGINAFREFLQFAEKGYFDVPIDTEKSFDSDFEESLALFLTKNGYKVQPQVGMSGFFIDIGVVDPNNENKFFCGIECDGATYHSSRSARDRDRLRQEILESRGWKIYRIWSTDWFHRRHDQEAKLLDYLASLSNADREPILQLKDDQPIEVFHDIFESIVRHSAIEGQVSIPYEEFDEKIDSFKEPHEIPLYELGLLIKRIVDIEGPIHHEEVARRVSKAFSKERSGNRIQDRTLKTLQQTSGLLNEGKFWFSETHSKFTVRDRSSVTSRTLVDAAYIPPQEIRVALRHLANESVQIEDIELIQQVSRLLGFRRCGPDLKQVIQSVLDLEINKSLKRENNLISPIK
ncbi:DUF3320 domain-containing protein [Nitrosomonas sp.]|uniref:DUF3320 domain-containing protein n=1 Tax=Nitrosomonas sp. TaxID=42353 RepID=UPI00374D8227